MLSFKPVFSLSFFTFFKRLFSSSSLSDIKVVASVYLRLLVFLPAILIPACASSSPAFCLMYSAYKLNEQDDNIQTWSTPFPSGNQSVILCQVLTVPSWPAYRFLRRELKSSAIPSSWRVFHSLLWSTQRLQCSQWSRSRYFWGIPLLFLWSSRQMLAIWSLVHLPFLNPSCTSGSSQFTCYWSLAWRILSIILLACEMSAFVW